MKNTNFSRYLKLWVAALVLVCGVAFTGCKPGVVYRDNYVYVLPMEADSALIGDWKSDAEDGYTITQTTMKYNASWGYNWTGTIVGVSENCIYYKFSEVGEALDSSIIGKYGATSYVKQSDAVLKLSDATAPDYSKGAEATLEEAVKELTIENGYYSYYGTYNK